MTLRATIVSARDALEDGDYVYAAAILDSALEDGPSTRSYQCSCGNAYEWPGLLDAHLERSGHAPLRDSWRVAA